MTTLHTDYPEIAALKYNNELDENALRVMRALLGAAREMEKEKDSVWPEVLVAKASNILAGVVHRQSKIIILPPR